MIWIYGISHTPPPLNKMYGLKHSSGPLSRLERRRVTVGDGALEGEDDWSVVSVHKGVLIGKSKSSSGMSFSFSETSCIGVSRLLGRNWSASLLISIPISVSIWYDRGPVTFTIVPGIHEGDPE